MASAVVSVELARAAVSVQGVASVLAEMLVMQRGSKVMLNLAKEGAD